MISGLVRILSTLLSGYHERFGQAGRWCVVLDDGSTTGPITLGCAVLIAGLTPGRIARHRSKASCP